MSKKRKKRIDSLRDRTKMPRPYFDLLWKNSRRYFYIVLTTISNKDTDTHRPPELKHRQMRHDVCKLLSNKDNRAAINTDNWFQHPSCRLTRHFVSSHFTRLTEIKQTKHTQAYTLIVKAKKIHYTETLMLVHALVFGKIIIRI